MSAKEYNLNKIQNLKTLTLQEITSVGCCELGSSKV